MGTQSPAPSTRGRGEYNPQAVLTGSGRCLLPAQGMTWFPSTAACMSVAPSCRLLGEQERELSTNPSLALAACAPWQGASEHPPRFLLCCPGGLGSTELTHCELPAPQGPRNYMGRAGAWLARWRQRAGPGADLCSQICPTWKKQSPAPPSAVGTAQPSLGSLHMVRSWVRTGCAWCPAPWEPCGWDSCQAGHTPSAGRGSAALTQLTEPALEPRPAVTAVGLGIPGAGAAVPAGVRGAVLPLTCNTHTALRAQGCRTARPTPQQPPGIGQLWGMPCPLFSLQQGQPAAAMCPACLQAPRVLPPDLLLLFASLSCSARLPWLDTSAFSSFTGASGSGQREGQVSLPVGARPKGSPSDGVHPAHSIRGVSQA